MCKWKVFEPGFKFTTTCIFTGAQHEHTVVSREGDCIVCDAVYHENDGIHHVEESFEIKKTPVGKEYIVYSEYKGEEFRQFADDAGCCYKDCLQCPIEQCTTGQVARELGEGTYNEYIEAYKNFVEAADILEIIQNKLESSGHLSQKTGKKLVEFEVEEKKYTVYGEYELKQGTFFDEENNRGTYEYPEFCSLSAKVTEDGNELDYNPEGVSWSGRKYTVADMIQDFLSKQMMYSKLYKAVYVEEGLQELIDWYHFDVAGVFNLLQIPKRILSNDCYDLFELQLVTSKYIYYMCNESCLMLNLADHSVLSDNSFACDGYMTSVENIRSGNCDEVLVWGKLPEE